MKSRKKTTETYSCGGHAGCFAILRYRVSSGLTLVELITAISILSILMAIAVPNLLSWIPDYRLKRAVKDLYSNMQIARLTAIKSGSGCSIAFVQNPDQYAISGLNRTIVLETYGSGVAFAHPESGSAVPSTPMTFSATGLLNPPSRYACLTNAGNTDYWRVGALTSGIIRTQKWNGSGWE